MFIRRVYISNFKSFDARGEFVDLNENINILVGKNDTGKTNFIDALDIILGNKSPYQIYLDAKDYNDSNKSIDIEVELVEIEPKDVYRISLLSELQKKLVLQEKPEGELVLKYHRSALAEKSLEESEEATPVYAFNKKKKTGMLEPRIRKNVFDIRKVWIKQIISPSLRNPTDYLNPAKKFLPFSILLQELISESKRRNDLKQVLDSANALLNEIFLNVQNDILKNAQNITTFDSIRFGLTKENQPEELVSNISLFLKLRNKEFEINQVGTGAQSAVIIAILELFLNKKAKKAGGAHKIFIIEEPEIYLHPHAIRRVSKLLQKLSQEPDIQIIITTHSPDLAILGLPFNIFRFDLVENSTKISKFNNIDKVLDLKNKAFREISRSNSEIFFAKSVLLVEGETEQALMPILAKSYIPPGGVEGDIDLDKFDISLISIGSKDNFEFYYRYLKELRIKSYFLFDGDIPDSTLDALIKLFDIKSTKNKREEKVKALEDVGVHILSVNEVEDFYTDKILAQLKNCSEEDIKNQIDKEIYYNKAELRNMAIRQLIKEKQDDILDASMDVQEEQIEKWYQEQIKSIRDKGIKGEKRRGKAVEKIFSDMGKVQLGRAIAEIMVKEAQYPKELMDFISKICKETAII